jgi:hypothetical protein
LAQNFPIEKKQRAQRLVLSRSRHIHLRGQMRQKCGDLRFRHFAGVTFVMEENESFDPVAICLLGPDAVVFSPDDFPNLIEQLRLVCA